MKTRFTVRALFISSVIFAMYVAFGVIAGAQAPLAVGSARITINGTSNIHAYTASTATVNVTRAQFAAVPAGPEFWARGWAVVEQEAASGLMMFSKRVHLVLDIQEQADAVLFRDRCGRSFARYESAWRLSQQGAQTVVDYELTAQPRFDVQDWMLKRVVRRDSAEMIGRLQLEIATRGAPVPQPSR